MVVHRHQLPLAQQGPNSVARKIHARAKSTHAQCGVRGCSDSSAESATSAPCNHHLRSALRASSEDHPDGQQLKILARLFHEVARGTEAVWEGGGRLRGLSLCEVLKLGHRALVKAGWLWSSTIVAAWRQTLKAPADGARFPRGLGDDTARCPQARPQCAGECGVVVEQHHHGGKLLRRQQDHDFLEPWRRRCAMSSTSATLRW